MWFALPLLGVQLPLIYCLLFGALISPTDPIAVMGILKSAGAPKDLELVIAGESLFNDGVGVVIFSLLLGMLASGATPTPGQGLRAAAARSGRRPAVRHGARLRHLSLLKSVDNYQVEVLLTLAAVTGGYALASQLHVSGPLAMVVVGLIIGNHGRALAMSDTTRRYLDMFWELLDEILNAVLFVLIGLEITVLVFSAAKILAGRRDDPDSARRAAHYRVAAREPLAGCVRLAAGFLEDTHLGRPARWHLGCARAVAADGRRKGHSRHFHVRDRDLFDSGTGIDHRGRRQAHDSLCARNAVRKARLMR